MDALYGEAANGVVINMSGQAAKTERELVCACFDVSYFPPLCGLLGVGMSGI
ncbi:hypothetical protein ACX80R_09995 [Paeniglutamicibacter antarcticus]|uniref:Uncharacterized protein n=1 Tax=Paeniglutamicibacter antarcticus TaxID=494023 RepID=A0ABP9TPC8_9MICC